MPELKIIDQSGSIMLVDITAKVDTTWGFKFTQTRTFLFGQDSNSRAPFTTQVHRYFRTVAEAIDWLMPKPIRDAKAQGLDVKRQGDWFFVPCPAPTIVNTVSLGFLRGALKERFQEGVLYTWTNPTNHRAFPRGLKPVDCPYIVYSANDRHFVRGTIEATDHPDLVLGKQWHLAIRRRRLQSGERKKVD